MAFVNPTSPNLPDYLTWLSETVQIPTSALPSNSPWPGYVLNQAIDLVLLPPGAAGILYVLTCYNCATHLLFLLTPDQQGQTYFADARSNKTSPNFPNGGFSLNQPQLGLVTSTFDQGTGATVTTPDWAAGLTVSQLGFFQTLWGRQYLAWQQSYGSTIVDLT